MYLYISDRDEYLLFVIDILNMFSDRFQSFTINILCSFFSDSDEQVSFIIDLF